jgi:hypothetical protein
MDGSLYMYSQEMEMNIEKVVTAYRVRKAV